jgi:hypothetical protein
LPDVLKVSYCIDKFQNGMRHGEEFCMGVHAHSLFVKDWDTTTLSMWGSINNEVHLSDIWIAFSVYNLVDL